jgi:hypothetical protein
VAADNYRLALKGWVEHLLNRDKKGVKVGVNDSAHCHLFPPFYEGFDPTLKLEPVDEHVMLTFHAFDADVRAEAYHLPLIAATGVLLPEP